MRDLTKLEQAAIEAVTKRFSATWEMGSGRPDVYIAIARQRVAVDIATLKPRGAEPGNSAKARLRFDKVVTRLMGQLQASLAEMVPNGVAVLLTVTAPIRLPSKTAAALDDKIQTLLGCGASGRDLEDSIHGNRVRIRILSEVSEVAPKLIGFVHNPDSDPLQILNPAQAWLELIDAEAGRRAPTGGQDRWLVVVSPEGSSCLEIYRYLYSQVSVPTHYQMCLMVIADGRVESLSE
ncbi:MAG TPA: hypothetical protein VMF06_08805 [Candidatus Limnocylindria bacterium]|nr:hypothetical protein [Candidatus Limnocylindria bacterium]